MIQQRARWQSEQAGNPNRVLTTNNTDHLEQVAIDQNQAGSKQAEPTLRLTD